MANAIVFVFTDCAGPAREAEFSEWYNSPHIPDILQAEGFVAATRYQVLGNPGPGQGKFLAVYEVEADDLAKAFAGVQNRLGGGTGPGRIIHFLPPVGFPPRPAINPR